MTKVVHEEEENMLLISEILSHVEGLVPSGTFGVFVNFVPIKYNKHETLGLLLVDVK